MDNGIIFLLSVCVCVCVCVPWPDIRLVLVLLFCGVETLIATAVPSSKYTLLSSAVAVGVTAVSWGKVEHTARFRQVSVFFLGLKGKCCVNLRHREQKIDERPLGDGIAEWGWCLQTLSWLGQSREDKMSSMRSSFVFGLKCFGNTHVLSLPYQ